MKLENYHIESHNTDLLPKHQRKLAVAQDEVSNAEEIIQKLIDFQIGIQQSKGADVKKKC